MAFDFPNTPAEGATYSPANGPQYIFQNGVWKQVLGGQSPVLTALSRNRIVNGAMLISQENGGVAGTTNGYYAADQWYSSFSTTGVVQASRAPSDTGSGAQYVLAAWVLTADTSLAVTEHYTLRQNIEGIRLSDFMWGAANARQAILRFSFLGPPGTYSVAMMNAAADRSFVAAFTCDGTRQTHTIVIPGDTAGTWPKTNVLGAYLIFTLACGTQYTKAPGSWGAGVFLGATGMSNGLSVVSGGGVNGFNIYDVGFYLDRDQTGKAPPWETPDEAEELAACQRYFQNIGHGGIYHGLITGVTGIYLNVNFPPMRVGPAITGVQAQSCYGAGAAPTTPTSSVPVQTGINAMRLTFSHSAALTGIIGQSSGILLNARI